ncbi:AMIN-like domain-containing (lipo)protein [Modestobacter sp. URMC 112]
MNHQQIRARVLVLFLAVIAALGVTAAAPAGASPSCSTGWGSLPKVGSGPGWGPSDEWVDDVRAGRHACFDRLVVDLGWATGFDAYDVRYVSSVTEDGSGRTVPLRGGADLQVTVPSMPYDSRGRVQYAPADRSDLVDVSGFSTFRQVAWAGAFEGETTLGLGTRARLPFRVTVLSGPAFGQQRLVVDVAHRW